MNLEWKLCYPEATISYLARINSDHCLFLLSLYPNLGQRGVRPFRFQPVWLSHDGFSNIVKEAWEGNHHNVCHAINSFTNKAKIWNNKIFGNIFWKKRNLTARLVGVEKALANAPSQRLINIHKFLLGELEKILDLEEELWGMKARTNWLIQGERNTTFFHISTLNRRSNNQIFEIKDPDGSFLMVSKNYTPRSRLLVIELGSIPLLLITLSLDQKHSISLYPFQMLKFSLPLIP